jgi:hypothetical protein
MAITVDNNLFQRTVLYSTLVIHVQIEFLLIETSCKRPVLESQKEFEFKLNFEWPSLHIETSFKRPVLESQNAFEFKLNFGCPSLLIQTSC